MNKHKQIETDSDPLYRAFLDRLSRAANLEWIARACKRNNSKPWPRATRKDP